MTCDGCDKPVLKFKIILVHEDSFKSPQIFKQHFLKIFKKSQISTIFDLKKVWEP